MNPFDMQKVEALMDCVEDLEPRPAQFIRDIYNQNPRDLSDKQKAWLDALYDMHCGSRYD